MINETKVTELKKITKKLIKFRHKVKASLASHKLAKLTGTDEQISQSGAILRTLQGEIVKNKALFKTHNSHDFEGVPNFVSKDNNIIDVIALEELYTTYKDHERLTVFANKGVACIHPDCNRIGTKLVLTMDSGGKQHVDLYTDNWHLMTVDHIHPKSKGGGEELENKQPMCYQHNIKKSNNLVPY